jgi:DNA-binding FrmR family transcriptional regulator
MDMTPSTVRRLQGTIAAYEKMLGEKPTGRDYANEVLEVLRAARDAIDSLSNRVEALEKKARD